MDVLDRVTALRVERLRLIWDYNKQEAEIHRARLLQLFTVALGAALAAVGSVILDKVPAEYGVLFALSMLAIAGYAHARLLLIPRRLRRAAAIALRRFDALISKEVDSRERADEQGAPEGDRGRDPRVP